MSLEWFKVFQLSTVLRRTTIQIRFVMNDHISTTPGPREEGPNFIFGSLTPSTGSQFGQGVETHIFAIVTLTDLQFDTHVDMDWWHEMFYSYPGSVGPWKGLTFCENVCNFMNQENCIWIPQNIYECYFSYRLLIWGTLDLIRIWFVMKYTVEHLYYGHPWDWDLLSLIERCPGWRGQIEWKLMTKFKSASVYCSITVTHCFTNSCKTAFSAFSIDSRKVKFFTLAHHLHTRYAINHQRLALI
jgi:hypothetical protein